jgi:N-acetylmuramoyl-L-alanine amidase
MADQPLPPDTPPPAPPATPPPPTLPPAPPPPDDADTRHRLYILLTAQQAIGLTAYGEARGESILGVAAVCSVIRNRYLRGYRGATTFQQVCLRPYAFSCWNFTDPNAARLHDLAEALITGRRWPPLSDRIVLETCLWLADRLIDGKIDDLTQAATHYFATSLATPPAWARPPGRHTITIGGHHFWAAVA